MKMKMLVTAAVALALLATMGIFAVANPPLQATGMVTARATVNPMIVLTVPATVDFGAVNPAVVTTRAVGLEVRSNRNFNLDRAITGDVALLNFTTSLDAQENQPRGVTTFEDIYTINVPYTTAPGDYTASVTYTVTQQ